MKENTKLLLNFNNQIDEDMMICFKSMERFNRKLFDEALSYLNLEKIPLTFEYQINPGMYRATYNEILKTINNVLIIPDLIIDRNNA